MHYQRERVKQFVRTAPWAHIKLTLVTELVRCALLDPCVQLLWILLLHVVVVNIGNALASSKNYFYF